MNQLKRPTDSLSSGQLEVKCVGHKLRSIFAAIPESNPTILQPYNPPICGNLQIPQQNYLSSALVVFLCQRQANVGGGSLCKIAAKWPSQRCLVRHGQSQGHKYAVSISHTPASSSSSACCPASLCNRLEFVVTIISSVSAWCQNWAGPSAPAPSPPNPG